MKDTQDQREYEKLEREKREDEESLKNKKAAEDKAMGGGDAKPDEMEAKPDDMEAKPDEMAAVVENPDDM